MIQDLAKDGLADMEGWAETADAHLHPILSLFALPKFRVWYRHTFRRLWSRPVSYVMHFRRICEGVKQMLTASLPIVSTYRTYTANRNLRFPAT